MSIPTIVTAPSVPTAVRAADSQAGGGSSSSSGFGALLDEAAATADAVAAIAPSAAATQLPTAANANAAAGPAPAAPAAGEALPSSPAAALPAPVPAPAEVAPALPKPANDTAADAGTLPLDDAGPAGAVLPETLPPVTGDDAAVAAPAVPAAPQPAKAPQPAANAATPAGALPVAKAADKIIAEEPAEAAALPVVKTAAGGKKQAATADAGPDVPSPAPAPVQMADAPVAPVAPPQAVAAQDAPPLDTEDAASTLSGALERVAAASGSPSRAEAPAGAVAGDGAAPASQNMLPAAGTMSSALMTQSLPGTDAKAASFDAVYAAHQVQPGREAGTSVVSAQPGRIGQEMGVEIARHAAAGRDEIIVRLDPPEMGRVEVRMSFDRDNSLRAVVAAEHHGALDLLKRDTGDLVRALSDAGIRSDSQSFRFDSRGGDASGQSWRQGQQQDGQGRNAGGAAASAEEEPVYRPLRTSGRIDLMA